MRGQEITTSERVRDPRGHPNDEARECASHTPAEDVPWRVRRTHLPLKTLHCPPVVTRRTTKGRRCWWPTARPAGSELPRSGLPLLHP